MKVSVCMATFNGERFLAAQLRSILDQLGPDDEVVVVDDCSTDDTVGVITKIADPRITIVLSPENRGHVASFERSITHASNEVIVLADQDDVWLPGRLAQMVELLSGRAACLATEHRTLDMRTLEESPSQKSLPRKSNPVANIALILLGRISYFGCAMAFRRDFRHLILPFPKGVESHDLWIAIIANLAGTMRHHPQVSIIRRVHDSNASPSTKRPFARVLRSRLRFLYQVLVALARLTRARRRPLPWWPRDSLVDKPRI